MSKIERLLITIGAALVGGLIILGLGYYWGWHHEKQAFDAYKAKVEAAAQVQTERVKQQEKEHEKLTEDIVNGYEDQLAALNKRLATRRMQHDNGSGAVPRVSEAPVAVNDAARESGSDPRCAALEERAARDALKLQNLQEWLRGI